MTTTAACCSSSRPGKRRPAHMTSRTRNLSIIALMLALLAAAAYVITTKRTVLGLDLRGGVELVYEGRPTPAGARGHARGDRRRDRDDPQAHRRARRVRARDPARGRRPDLDRPARRAERRPRDRAGGHHREAAVLRLGAQRAGRPRARRTVRRLEGALPGGRAGLEVQAQGRADRPRGPARGHHPGAGRPQQRHRQGPLLPVRARPAAGDRARHHLRGAAGGLRVDPRPAARGGRRPEGQRMP